MIAYTDGSAKCNGKKDNVGGYGVVLVEDDNETYISQYQHFEFNTTNNIQELKAILYVMVNFGKMRPRVKVYSDSAYCVNTLTKWMYSWAANGWKKADNKIPENLELIRTYYELEEKGFSIDLQKIAGHTGNKWNELADAIATGRWKGNK